MSHKSIKILLIDNHAILRKSIALLLSEEADINVVGETGDAEKALKQVSSLKPDIALITHSMPQLNGIKITQDITARFPYCKVIGFSTHSDKQSVDNMLSAGAMGYLLKECEPAELIAGIHSVMRGEIVLSSTITSTVLEAYVEQISEAPANNKQINENTDILRTKLHSPAIVSGMVPRPHLNNYLTARQVRPLIMVSAPAGYGKSILISSWLKSGDWPGVWISLDKNDSDLRQFLMYFLTAIQDIFPDSCSQSLLMIHAPQLPSISCLLTSISNELGLIKQPFILVLDDFYRINTLSPVNELINHLLERPPLPLHLVIISRRDPPLQLVTLRAKEQLTEIRMQELCFSREETQSLLEKTAAFTASNDVLDSLHKEIEGWVVGLRLVSQVLQTNNEQQLFLQNLHSGVQQSNLYLLQEVYERQTSCVQEYMLQSSVLNRFCAPLCEATVQAHCHKRNSEFNAEKFIHELAEGNLFSIALDAHGKWFRYHHLFQQLLHNELTKRMSTQEIAELHNSAAQWFITQGLIDEAIEHYLMASNTIAAAEVIEQTYWYTKEDKYSWHNLEKWLSMLPSEIKEQRPYILLSQIWIMHVLYQINKAPPLVKKFEQMAIEKHLDETCMGALKFFQGMLHYWSGRGKEALTLHLEAKKILPEICPRLAAINEVYISMTSHMANRAEFALALCNKSMKEYNSQNIILYSRLFFARAVLHMLSAQLLPAIQDAKKVNTLLAQPDAVIIEGWGNYIQASAHFKLNNLTLAEEHFTLALKQKYTIHRRVAIDSMIGLALTQQITKNADAAKKTINELLQFIVDIEQPEHLSAALSGQVRLALAQGDITLAKEWLKSFNETPPAASMLFWLDNPLITKIRVLIALDSPEALQQAATILDSLLQETEDLHNSCQIIHIITLQVLILDKQGHSTAAHTALERLIALTEPGQWLQPFIEAGQPMVKILQSHINQTDSTDYTKLLLEQCQSMIIAISTAKNKSSSSHSNNWQGEALTNRELDILELLIQHMQNKEMAAQLSVSPETIKTHLKHLYQKLGVNSRRAAADIAKEILFSQKTEN